MARKVPVDQFEGLGLRPRMILVKFFGVSEKIVETIPERNYNLDEISAKRREEAEQLGISMGIKRDGMDDTGTDVLSNRQWVSVQDLMQDFQREGYRVAEAGWFWHQKEGKPRKRVLEIVLRDGLERDCVALPSGVRQLFTRTVQWVNCWANMREELDGEGLYRLDTVNLNGFFGSPAEEVARFSASPGRYTYFVEQP